MAIKNFCFFSKRLKSVSIHFNLKNHNFNDHFHFYIYRKDIENLNTRLFNESFLINLCKILDVKIMNDHIPHIKEYYN